MKIIKTEPILSLSPLDGRYKTQAFVLRDYFSEAALIKYRIQIEIFYLIDLIEFLKIDKISLLEKNKILAWLRKLTPVDFQKVKIIEKETNHDVKAVEYFIKDNLQKLDLEKFIPLIHWGLTSEDTNNLAYALMVQQAKDKIIIPNQIQLIKLLVKMAAKYANLGIPARTHGQIAVPTTLGKELIVFASRASFFLTKMINLKMKGKLNGAVGNFNAQKKIFPQKNWLKFSREFVNKLNLDFNLTTTQKEAEGSLIYFLDLLRQVNNVWLNLSQDCWFYISLNYFRQKIIKQEVGSSTMPHKINPINFENAEGNFQLANGLLITLSNKLAISRMQRDLSDSTVKRNLGISFGYSLLALKNLIKGLNKIKPNKSFLIKELESHPEMLTEALQLILKIWGQKQAYQKIKLKVRGKKINWQEIIKDLEPEQKKFLKNWKPSDYLGLAQKITKQTIKNIQKTFKNYL